MLAENHYPLSAYKDISPLCEKGHVMLVQGKFDGQLYVKKVVQCYNPEFYMRLMANPVKNTPVIYGIYVNEEPGTAAATNLTVIEEYVPGETLAEHLATVGAFSEKDAIDIVMQLCRILMDLHNMKPPVIHRDIKPSNIMLLPDGRVKLLDFDAAKAENTGKNRDTVLLGTAGFAAPEQYGFSASSPRTDIYAVGVLLNILLTCKLPSVQMAEGKLKKVVRRCMEFSPKDRYAHVKELYTELKYLKGVKIEWLPPGFRALKWYRMIPAFLGYAFYIIFILRTDTSGFENESSILTFRAFMLIAGFLTICFWTNYMNTHRWFPFMRSRYLVLRIVGYISGTIAINFIVMLSVVMAEMAFLQ